jgi:hypothetical protein
MKVRVLTVTYSMTYLFRKKKKFIISTSTKVREACYSALPSKHFQVIIPSPQQLRSDVLA